MVGAFFWSDLASAHYARNMATLLEEAGVPFIAREENPLCMPPFCPIVDFWGIIKQEVFKGEWKAMSEQQLKDRVRRVLRLIGEEVPMEGLLASARCADRHHASSVLH